MIARPASGWLPAAMAGRTCRAFPPLEIVALSLLRFPQTPAREPLHLDVRVLALELTERRQQFFLLPRAECGRLGVD
jgi:hypothetical protein